MLRLILIIGMSTPCWSAGVQCYEDFNCQDDYYCELDNSCRKCLRCDVDFKRAPPPIPTACVKSMMECGACLDTKSQSSNNDCGDLRKGSEEYRLPLYAWLLLVLIVAVVIGGATIISWKKRASYATVPRSEGQISPRISDHTENEWSSPPAYNTVVDIPRPNNGEDAALFVKSEMFTPVDKSRESADRQATRPFSPPNYVRHPQPSPTFAHDEIAISNNEDQSSVDGVIAVRVQPMPAVDHVHPTETVRNMALEGCPNITSAGNNLSIESSPPNASTAGAHGGPPVVVVNNNVHLQSVSLSGASIFLPQSSNHVERR